VWKSYRTYHQRSHTLKEKFLSRRNRYDEFWALKGIELEIPSGSTTGIIGANGSGKSTLLKTMARILTPNRGFVEVNGTMSSLLELGIGFHPELTGRENVYLSGSLLGRSRRDVDGRYDEIVEFAGIERFMDAPVKNYSTGMYARLAFAVAVSVEPEILLVDEVLSVGDESFQSRCFERMAKFRRDGHTVIIVTHGLDTVRGLCPEAVWIEDGAIKKAGPSSDVVAAYFDSVHGGMNTEGKGTGALPGDATAVNHAVIRKVNFLGGDGKEAETFQTGDAMTVRVECETEIPLQDMVCCIAVYRADSFAYMIGRTSHEADFTSQGPGLQTIDFSIADLPLLPGGYLVSVGFQDREQKDVYDWHDRRYGFFILNDPGFLPAGGSVHVKGTWKARSSAPLGSAHTEP
jgi:lipopolysaccharide transport system ATP-binding protein